MNGNTRTDLNVVEGEESSTHQLTMLSHLPIATETHHQLNQTQPQQSMLRIECYNPLNYQVDY